jgi:DNA-binding XRE family transcriptional regulator
MTTHSEESRAFGAQVRAWRQDSGIERSTLAQWLGVSENTVRNIENGQRCGRKTQQRIAELMTGDMMQLHDISEAVTLESTQMSARMIVEAVLDPEAREYVKQSAEKLGVSQVEAWLGLLNAKLKTGMIKGEETKGASNG